MNDILIAQAARKLIDAPYCLGNEKYGWDCLSMMWEFYGNLGIKLPRRFKGYSDDDYAERWRKGEGREELFDYLTGLGEEVQENYERSGDLMIFDGKEWVFPGIYLGSGHILCAFEKGCMVVPFKMFKHALVGIRRLA